MREQSGGGGGENQFSSEVGALVVVHATVDSPTPMCIIWATLTGLSGAGIGGGGEGVGGGNEAGEE